MLKRLSVFFAIFCLISAYCTINTAAKENFELSAECAVLIEANSGRIIYGKNAHKRHAMASTTKIMSALITLESTELDSYFTVDSSAIVVEGSTMGLQKGDKVTKRALVYGMLLPSGNDAANAGAVAVAGSIGEFVKLMNKRADMLGMKDTSFETPSGLDGKNHYSTAYDMAILARAAIANPEFLKICSTKTAKVSYGNPPYTRYLKNHNRLLKEYKGAIGVKTGFTKKAGRCLVSAAKRDGVTLIAVVFNAPSDWSDSKKLLDYGFSRLSAEPFAPDVSDIRINVVGSSVKTIMVEAGDTPKVCLEESDKKKLIRKVIADRFYYAPVKAGDLIGSAKYYLNGVMVADIPLIAAENAESRITEVKKPFFERVTMFFKNLWFKIVNLIR